MSGERHETEAGRGEKYEYIHAITAIEYDQFYCSGEKRKTFFYEIAVSTPSIKLIAFARIELGNDDMKSPKT